jgi:hypothetical protein
VKIESLKNELKQIREKYRGVKEPDSQIVNAFLAVRERMPKGEQQLWDEIMVKEYLSPESELSWYARASLCRVCNDFILRSLIEEMKLLDVGARQREVLLNVIIDGGGVNEYVLMEISRYVELRSELIHFGFLGILKKQPDHWVFCVDTICDSLNQGNIDILSGPYFILQIMFFPIDSIVYTHLLPRIVARKPKDLLEFSSSIIKTADKLSKKSPNRAELLKALRRSLRVSNN